jgi:hypothetical protein
MQVGVMVQRLPPGMEHAKKPDLGPQMLWIPGNGLECLGHGLKQQGIHDPRMLEGERAERRWQGKDHVAVRNRQQLLFPRRQPGGLSASLTLRAVSIPAGIIADLFVATGIALPGMAPQSHSAALRDGLEYPTLGGRCHRAITGEIGRTVLPDDIGDFQVGAGHG